MTKKLEQHPLSAAYPSMGPDDFQAMQDSIGSVGVHTPIVMFEGKVLDGWHRFQVCDGFGMACPSREFGSLETDGDDPGQFVKDMNSARRHLSAGQRALAEAEVQRIMIARGATAPGAVVTTVVEQTGVSKRTAEQASVVSNRATPEVKAAVKDGVISLKKAEKISKLPKREQKAAITAPPAPAWRPASNAPLPRPVVGASTAALDEMKERNQILIEEVDRLTDRLAVVCVEGATDEEKLAYSATLAELRAEVATLTVKLQAVTDSRDSAVAENNELKRECAKLRNQLSKHR
jgi:hypothetical protein